MKAIGTIFGALCVATVLTQLLAVGYLAMTGRLTNRTLADVRNALNGDVVEPTDSEAAAEKGTKPSIDDVVEKRIGRVWELDRRQKELSILKGIVTRRKEDVTSRQDKFSKSREKLLKDLAEKEKALQAESTKKARTILAEMEPANAVKHLMKMPLDKSVLLLKGMQERTVAEYLSEFSKTKEGEEQAKQILDAISRGEPQNGIIQQGLQKPATPTKAKPKAPAAN